MRITFKSGAVILGSTLAVCGLLAGAGCGPPGPRALLQGERLIKEGKYAEAQAKLKMATALIPQNAQAWNHLGMAYHGSRMYLEAAGAYEQALKLNRDLSVVHYNFGSLLLDMGNPSAAQQHLTSYTLMQPRMSDGWFKLGVAQMQLGQNAAAKMSLDQALALDGSNADAWNTLGMVYVQLNRPREAWGCYENALKFQTNHSSALLNEAILLQQYLKNRPLALLKYREYLQKNPTAPDFASIQAIVAQLEAEFPTSKPLQANTIGAITVRTNPAPAPLVPAPRTVQTNLMAAATVPAGAQTNALPQPTRQIAEAPAITNKTERVPATNAAGLSFTFSTNRESVKAPPVATNIVSKLPTNRIAALESPAKPVASIVSTNPVVSNAPPRVVVKAQTPEVPILQPIEEVTRLESEPPIKLPGDEAEAAVASADTEAAAAETATTNAPALASSSLLVRTPAPEKRSLLQKANPANWFRSRSKETPLPAVKASEAKPQPSDSDAAETKPPQVAQPEAVAPVIARYPYRNPPKPAQGDVAAAKLALAQAYKDLRAGQWNQAMDGFKKAVAADPACYEARFRLGLGAFQSSNVPQALLEYEYALAIDPASANARFNFALALQKANYHRDAVNELEKLQTASPKDARVQLFLANIYAQQLRQPQQARVHYLRVLELEPQHPEASSIRYWLAANP